MAEEDLEIKMKAVGGSAAAAEIEKPEDAARRLADAIRKMRDELVAGGATDEEAAASLTSLQEQLNAITDAVVERAEAEKAAAAVAAQAREIADAAQAEAAKRLAAEVAATTQLAEEAAAMERLGEETTFVVDATNQSADAATAKTAALGRLNGALSRVIPGYGAVKSGVNEITEAWRASGVAGATFGQRLLALAGGPIGIGIAAVTALVGYIGKLRGELRAAGEAAEATRDSNRSLGERLEQLKTPTDEAAEATRLHAEAIDAIVEKNAAYLSGLDTRATELARARDAEMEYRESIIDRQVAEGKMTAREAAVAKGELAREDLDRASTEAIATAEAKMAATTEALARASAELTAAQETARLAAAERTRAGDPLAAAEAARAASDRAANAVNQAANSAPDPAEFLKRGALSPAVAAALYTKELAAHTERVKAVEKEAADRKAEAEKWEKLARDENEAREAAVAAEKARVEAARDAVETLRRQQAAAAAEFRAAEQGKKLGETYGQGAIANRTAGDIARIDADEKRKADKEKEKADREAARRLRDEQMAALQFEIKEDAPGFARRADRVAAAGLTEEAKAMDQIASGLANGAGLGELESALHKVGETLAAVPDAQRAIVVAAVAPLEAALADYRRRTERIESQFKNGRP